MTIRDMIASGVKTAVQVAVAASVGWLASLGIEIDAPSLETVLFALVSGAVASGLNALGAKYPILNRVLSFGLAASPPSYS